jgi:GNAT superfamily N-acetyltransferase
MSTPSLPIRLRESDRGALETHFLCLGAEDRRLRFGGPIADEGLRAYVARIDFERDGVFAVHDDDLRLVAVVHVAFSEASAELGLSVLADARGEGLGNALLTRAVMHLRNRGSPEVLVHCLTENAAMMHLARKNGMRIIPAGSESDARLAIDPPTPHSQFAEWLQDNQASVVQSVRRNARFSRTLLEFFNPAGSR